MAHLLADETLDIILQQVLDVSDKDFFDVSGLRLSPFGRRQYSNSTVLLVCKRWMRIATPLLYKTVVLRSAAQAHALAKALKKTPGFAKYLHRLRLEGGFGVAAGKILRTATHLHAMHLSLDVVASDNVKPVCEALPTISPSCLAISLPPLSRNSRGVNTAAVVDAIQTSAPFWTKLTTLFISDDSLELPYIAKALFAIPNVLDLQLKLEDVYNFRCAESALERWPRCKVHIEYRNTHGGPDPRFEAFLITHSNRMIGHRMDADILAASASFGPPMQNAPRDVQKKIWTSILQHVLFSRGFVQCYDYIELFRSPEGRPLAEITTNRGAIRYMMVCRLFRNICTPVALRHLALPSDEAIQSFSDLLDGQPQLASVVESLRVYVDFASIRQLISRLCRLRQLAHCSVDIPGVEKLATCTVGPNLVALNITLDATSPPPTMWFAFPALRRLRIYAHSSRDKLATQPLFVIHLPQLEELSLGSFPPHWLVSCFAQAHLPRLRFLTAPLEDPEVLRGFMAAHSQVVENVATRTAHMGLVLSLCPNLHTLILAYPCGRDQQLPPPALALSQSHAALRRILLPHILKPRETRNALKKLAEEGMAFFAALQPEMLPALQEIVLPCTLWPVHPRDIAASPMVRWADSLKEKGITLLDKKGTAWRSRLKYGRAG